MNISAIAIRRPVFTVMVTAGLLILGLISFLRLGTDLFPDVNFPVVMITVPYPGAGPAEVETLVSKPIEDAVISINGIDRVRTYSRESQALVLVMFTLGTDLPEAATQVRERMTQVRPLLPKEILEPTISRFDVSQAPLLTYTLGGRRSLPELRKFAEDVLKPALEQVDGVASIEVVGGASREVQVDLDGPRIDALGLDATAIVQKLRATNMSIPAGRYDEGSREVSVRTIGEFRNVDAIQNAVVATSWDGSTVRLRDIAEVRDGFKEARTRIRANGEEAVAFAVHKQSGSNTVEVSNAVKERIAALEKSFPEGVSASPIVDQAHFIEENAHEVERSIVYGGLMAVLVILVFMLDLRSTLISAVALPTSVIGTFSAMYLAGFTLNMMTLLGLSLAIGLLIDDAVVVRENIFKHLERGEPPFEAALKGTQEIALSVLATTMTIVAVFVPIAFVKGVVGQFFRQFGITVAAAVLISLAVAFTLDPMLSARFTRTVGGEDERFQWLKRPFRRAFDDLDQAYRGLLAFALRHKILIGVGAVASLGFMGFLAGLTGNEFVAAEDRAQFVVDIQFPAGTALAETAERTLAAELALKARPEIRTVLSTLGQNAEANHVLWRIVAVPKTERKTTLPELKDAARRLASALPGAKVNVTDPPFVEGAQTEAPIMISVRGGTYADIEPAADAVAQILRSTPGVQDVDVKYNRGRPELAIDVDAIKAAGHALYVGDIAARLRTAIEGEEAGKLREGKDETPIRVRLRSEDRSSADAIAHLTLTTPAGKLALTDVAGMTRSAGPQVIERENRTRQIEIWAAPRGRPLGDIYGEIEPRIAALAVAPGVTHTYDGQIRMMNETNTNMLLSMLLAVVFIYLVLASQFESFIHPVTIMLTLPLALVGAVLALFLTGNPMAMGAMIGVIFLMGLVTKNAILLVDRAIVRVRDFGDTPEAAILEAGPERLRPILMTSAAMVLGMLPTAISNGEGSEFRAPMAIAIIGGVVSSTILSLVVVPAFYLAIENAKRRLFGTGKVAAAAAEAKQAEAQ